MEKSKTSNTDTLKPNAKEREQIKEIVQSFKNSDDITEEEKLLLWRFRHTLIDTKSALIKFLYCVDYNDTNEVQSALELLYKWRGVEIDDILILLSKEFTQMDIRRFAMTIIEKYILNKSKNSNKYNRKFPAAISAVIEI